MDTLNNRVRQMYLNACIYNNAARWINAKVSDDPFLLMPSMIYAALSLEIALKTVYFVIFGTDFKIGNRHSHDFYKLYHKLGKKHRYKLETSFENQLKTRDMSDVKIAERECSCNISLELQEHIKHWSRIFVDMRYLYDRQSGGRQMMFYPEIWKATIELLIELQPELATVKLKKVIENQLGC